MQKKDGAAGWGLPHPDAPSACLFIEKFLGVIKAGIEAIASFKCGFGRMENFALGEKGAKMIIRIPCVPGGNMQDMDGIIELLKDIKPEIVELLAYHKLGESKKEALGFGKTEFSVPSKAEMTALCDKFVKNGINAVYKG